MSKTTDILHNRRRLAFGIAEDLETQFQFTADCQWDLDKAAQVIERGIPLSHAEADAELEDLGVAQRGQPGVGHFRRLRAAVGMETGTVGEVIEAAIAALSKASGGGR